MAVNKLIIGSRGSKLALWQANHIAESLRRRYPDLEVTLEIIKTKGDKILDVSLSKVGGKGLFTKELEEAILRRDKPLLLLEVLKPPELERLASQLGALGYAYRFISEEDRVLHSRADQFWRSRESRNVLFGHTDGRIRVHDLGWQ